MNSRNIENLVNILKTLMAVVVSYAIAAVIIMLVSDMPQQAISSFSMGPFSTLRRFGNVIEGMIPIIFTGIGVSIMLSIRFFNLAVSGAFYMSAIIASAIALIPMSVGLHPIVGIFLGGITGAAICVLPALLKAKWGINEVVSALMFNFVATFIGSYILRFVLFDPMAGFMASRVFQDTVRLPLLIQGTRVHVGLILAGVVTVFAYIFLYHSKWGYSIRMTGMNKSFAIFSGIGVSWATIFATVIGGFIVGVGGASEMYGMFTRFQWTDLPTTGFDGVMVAAMARRNPALIPIAAFFLSYIRVGADIMARSSDVAQEIVAVIQAIIIMMIGAEALLAGLKKRAILKNSAKEVNV
ncbi:MAG: ABC transporter permease [Oscillospiraceae bacterium]|nr:ABC transporter permease [Oscillospiraceae bacterium]